MEYYTDKEKKRLDPTMVDEKAETWARSFGELKSAQMRR
jgi:CRISPR-associated protein Csm2